MSVTIAHASISENGTVKNGVAGDQTKKEVCTRPWYRNGWTCVIRFNEPRMAEKVAQCMENACKNNNIGYDQLQRNTLLTQARKYNYDVSKVNTPCETDCSALVSVACMYAGVPESALTLSGNCATTRTLQAVLKATGDVQIFTTPLYTANTARLKRGDILLKAGHHVVVVVDIGDNPYKLTSSLLKEGSIGESVAWLQYELNRHGANLDVDKQFGVKTKLAVLLFQKDNGLTQDGIVGEETINKLNELKA